MHSIVTKLNQTNASMQSYLVTLLIGMGLFGLAMSVQAGGTATTIFDSLNTSTTAAVFGPLGQAIIALGAAAGGILAVVKGMWLLAGLGIAVAALMFGASLVAGSSGFGALI